MCVSFLSAVTQVTLNHYLVTNNTFPRREIMERLLHVIKQQPKLAKEASSSLVDIAQAIHGNVTADETSTLLKGTLTQEVYVRTSCLQALQVSFWAIIA